MTSLESLRQLLTSQGQEALKAAMTRAPGETDFLAALQELTRRFPEAVARAAIDQAILRSKASLKFSAAEQMFFTRDALQQSTSEIIAHYRARRFEGTELIFDLGCGIGGDCLSLARVAPVVAIDHDPLRLLILALNARALGLSARVMPVLADIDHPAWHIPRHATAFFDPERRAGGRRLRKVAAYRPSLEGVLAWVPRLEGMAVKVGPAVDRAEIAQYECETEFVSLRGELKEATLWFAGFRTVNARATVLPGPHTLVPGDESPARISPPSEYLYEPDPAVLRAGLVRTLAHQIQAAQIDATISYLTSDRLLATPFARRFRILEVLPFNLKTLRHRLREMNVGRITIKKRGSPVDVEDLARRLRLRGDGEALVILTRSQARPVSIVVQELAQSEAPTPE